MNYNKNVNIIDTNKTVAYFQSTLSLGKIRDITKITNFSIPPSSTRNPSIIPSTIQVRRCQ